MTSGCLFAGLRNRLARLFDDEEREVLAAGFYGCGGLFKDRRPLVTRQRPGNLRPASCPLQQHVHAGGTGFHDRSNQRTVERASNGNSVRGRRLGECKIVHHAASLAMAEAPAE